MGAVAKLKETVTNDTLADKGGVAFAPMKFPEPVLSYAIEPKSRGDEDKISSSLAAAPGRGPDDPLQPRPADQGTAALGPGPAAHRGDGRQAEAAVRRRGEPQAAEDPVSGDDHRGDRRARPPQEADGRPRPVRRLLDPDGAAAARRRLRVRGRHLRRRDPADVPARRSRRASRRRGCAATWPATRSWTSRSRSSTASTTTSTRTNCRSRWPAASRSRTRMTRAGRRSSSRS